MSQSRRSPKRMDGSVRLWLQALEERTVPAGLGWADLATMPASQSGLPSNYSFESQRNIAIDTDALRAAFAAAPAEQAVWFGQSAGLQITLPRPDGSTASFAIADSPIMAPELAAQFPDIKTYAGKGIDDPAATIRLTLTPVGFNAFVLSPTTGTWSITPYYQNEDDFYVSFFSDSVIVPPDAFSGLNHDHDHNDTFDGPTAASGPSGGGGSGGTAGSPPGTAGRSGAQLRTYRLAVAATGEYTQAHGGTVASSLAGVVTDISQINAIYENDFSIRMVLVANNNSIIYTNSASDPYTNSSLNTMLGENQTNVDNVIGSANYDIGHVFAADNGGGLAGLGVVGNSSRKAQAASSYINFIPNYMGTSVVPHEMGHQFNANHTFNSANDTSNRNGGTAYEPGSGVTIMSYAGLISGDNYISGNIPTFNASAFDEVIRFVDVTIPGVGSRTSTGNAVPNVAGGNDYTIPANTFFELTSVATDANNDALTYSWEERDLGPAALHTDADNGSSPLFRVFAPTTNPARTFPKLSDIIGNTTTAGEQLYTRNRTSDFRVTVRDNRTGGGGVNTDDVRLTVVDTGASFRVTAPNTAVSWVGKTSQTVSWNVAGTTGNGINATNVRIRLSTDGGLTYPITVLSSTANDGSEIITVPNVDTTQARIRVEGANNVFFDISNTDFTITGVAGIVVTPVAGLSTTEAGGTAQFSVRLEIRPTGFVTIPISSNDLTEGTVSTANVQFSTSNWATPQIVTITGVDDPNVDGDIAYSIITGVAASSDARYAGINPSDVSVLNINDDIAGITISPTTTLQTTERGGQATFSMVLQVRPTADVVVPLSSNNTAEGTVSPAFVTFTPTDWDQPHVVTVTGVDDSVVDANVAYSIITGAATSLDPAYIGLNAVDVAVVNRNDDTALTLSATGSTFRYRQTNVPFTATIQGLNGGTAAGMVHFYSGALDLGTFPVNASGVAVMSTTQLPLGVDRVDAEFISDPFYRTSSNFTNVTIIQALLSVAASASTKVYGAPIPTLGYTATGFVDGENATIFTGSLSTTALASSPVGTFPIAVGNLSAGPKYEFSFTANSLDVVPASLAIAATPLSKLYGAAVPTLIYTPSGLVNGDTAAIITGELITGATSASPVGSYSIDKGTIAAGTNYTINYSGASLAVTPAPLTVSPIAVSKQYGPAAVPALTFTSSGFVNGDTAALLNGQLTTTALVTSPVGQYPISGGNLNAGANYNLTVTPANVTVTPAPLTVVGNNITSRLGAPIPTLTYNVNGLVNGDTIGVLTGVNLTTPATVNSTKGTYPVVVTGGVAGNYNVLPQNGTLTLTLSVALVGSDRFTVGAAAGGSESITVYDASGFPISSITPFPGFNGGIRTATGDVNGDGVPDIAAGTGPGTTAEVRVFDGSTGALLLDLLPFDDFTGGVFLSLGDMTGDLKTELVVTPDTGGGPRVSIYRGGDFVRTLDFFGIDDVNFRGGARTALGDINGDGYADLTIAAGFGGGPRVSILDGRQLSLNNIYGFLTSDFFAFGESLRDGVYVASGDVNGDGFAEVIIGAGPGGAPRILVLSGKTLLNDGGAVSVRKPLANFFSGNSAARNGVFVSARNLDNDAYSDLVVGGDSLAVAYDGRALKQGNAIADFSILEDAGPTGGVYVG